MRRRPPADRSGLRREDRSPTRRAAGGRMNRYNAGLAAAAALVLVAALLRPSTSPLPSLSRRSLRTAGVVVDAASWPPPIPGRRGALFPTKFLRAPFERDGDEGGAEGEDGDGKKIEEEGEGNANKAEGEDSAPTAGGEDEETEDAAAAYDPLAGLSSRGEKTEEEEGGEEGDEAKETDGKEGIPPEGSAEGDAASTKDGKADGEESKEEEALAEAAAAAPVVDGGGIANATMPPQPMGTSVIFMRPPSHPMSPHHRTPVLFGPGPPGGVPGPSPFGPVQPPGGGPPSPASELTGAAVALTASVLSLLARLLVLSLLYGINPFSSGESRAYTPSPAQHYAFERINERYARDGLALRKALDFAPPPGTLERAAGNGGSGGGVMGGALLGARSWRMRTERRRKERRRETRAASLAAAAAASLKHETNAKSSDGDGAAATLDPSLPYDRTVIVLDFCPSHHSSSGGDPPSPYHVPPDPIEALRDQISFVLAQYRDPTVRSLLGREVEVVLRLESPGGVVQDFGLAADQLARLRRESAEGEAEPSSSSFSSGVEDEAEKSNSGGGDDADGDKSESPSSSSSSSSLGGISLTVCVDRVAASGGYMLACQASPGRLLAAPFAALGSVGVLREGINVHDALRRVGVRPLVLRAGKDKVPLDMISEVKDEDVDKVQRDMDRVHGAFQRLVTDARPEIAARIEAAAAAAAASAEDSNEEGGDDDDDDGMGEGWAGAHGAHGSDAPTTTTATAISTSDGALTGEVYLGREALDRGLVDRLITSDEYVAERIAAGDRVLRLYRLDRSKFGLHLNPLDLLLFGSPNGGPLGRLAATAGRWRARWRGGWAEARARYPQWTAAARVGGAVGLAGLLRAAEGALAGGGGGRGGGGGGGSGGGVDA